MFICKACNEETKLISHTHGVCPICFNIASAVSNRDEITVTRALIRLAEEHRKARKADKEKTSGVVPNVPTTWYSEVEEDGVVIRKVVKQRNKPLSSEEYREEEYEFLDLDGEPDFGSVNQQLSYYRELLDVALLGNDIEWAKQIHAKIKKAEGKAV